MTTRNVGQPFVRRDGRAKVTGEAKYAYEVPVAGAVYGVLVTSAIAKGRLAEIDTSAAEREPGVVAVITPRNAYRLPGDPHLDSPDRVVQALQDDEIRYSNQPIAIAVADTFERAVHAAMLVRVKAEAASHTVRIEDELHGAFPHKITAGGKQQEPDESRGDIEAGLSAGAARVDEAYETPFETHNPLEPHATIASWSGDRLTVHDSSQWVFAVKKKLARVSLAAHEDGKLNAIRHHTVSPTSRFDVFVEASALQARHIYASPNLDSRHRLVRLDIGTPTFMRAPGESSGSFALESAMDELAEKLKIDPLALRLASYAEQDPGGKPYSSKSLRRCYEEGARKFGWEKRSSQPRSRAFFRIQYICQC